MDTLTILLTPNFNETRRSLDYNEFEDFDDNEVLFQQGYDIQQMEIEPGERFLIDRKWESASLQC